MSIFRTTAAAVILFGWVGLRAELPQTPVFMQESSDLPADPEVHYGVLPNGLRYAIRANHEPKERASFRLLVLAGSAQEKDTQRGLAHFIEHMAFKGSPHYPPGTLIQYFQRLGMSFGGDTNANTGFDRTIYLLELPHTDQKTIGDACQLFGDYARGELLLPHEIDTERGVILSEKRDRDSVEYRRYVALENFFVGTTLIPQRLPIGLTNVIADSQADVFRDYYDQWYRPERMAVVAVGDFDPAAVETAIKAQLSSLKAATPAKADPSLGFIPAIGDDRVLFRHEDEAGETAIVAYSIEPYTKEIDNRARRLRYLPRDLAVTMVNRRLGILARKADAPFIQASVSVSEHDNFDRIAGFEITCKADQWSPALTVVEKELHRALQFGFTAAEFSEAVANLRHGLEEAVKTAPTRRSRALADQLVDALHEGYVFTTPAEDLGLYEPALERLTPDVCAQAFRMAFHPANHYVAVAGNAQIPPQGPSAIPAEQQILSVYQAAQSATVTPPSKDTDQPFAYTKFGMPGKVSAQQHVEDLDLNLFSFANGVRLNFKKTDFESNRIHLTIRVGVGQLTEPKNKPGLALFASGAFVQGGLGRHSFDDIIRLSAGRTIGLKFEVDKDALVFSAATNREDLLFQLQLLTAFLTDAGYRPEALATARKNFEPMYQKLEHTPEGPLQTRVFRQLASGDPRFGIPPKADLLARNLEETRAWLEPQFKTGPIEIALAGDLDPAATVNAVAQTLGALPARETKPALTKERDVHFPEKPFEEELTVVTEIPRGLLALFWPTTDSRDVRLQRRTTLLAQVFADRLRVEVRDKLGDAYSPFARNLANETYPGYGFFMSYLEVDPAKSKKLAEVVLNIASNLCTQGVTEEELTRAKQPVLTSLRESSRTNGYWLQAVLESAQEHPQHIEWSRSRYQDFEAIAKPELDALAKRYLAPERVSEVIIAPEKANPGNAGVSPAIEKK